MAARRCKASGDGLVICCHKHSAEVGAFASAGECYGQPRYRGRTQDQQRKRRAGLWQWHAMRRSFGELRGVSRSARAQTRVLALFYTPIPSRGYGVHLNITHGALCATRCS